MIKEEVKRVKEEPIANDVNSNWGVFRRTDIYVCGDDEITKADACQFSLKPRYNSNLHNFHIGLVTYLT